MLVRVIRWGVVLCCVAMGLGVRPAAATAPPAAPVLVLGGFAADQAKVETLRAWLGARGYAAYSMLLPGDPTGTAAIADSARAVADRVAEIRRETGAARVDLVGHSMGGLAQRHYVKFLGGREQVGTYIDYGTPEHGTSLAVACAWAAGCRDLVPGSEFLTLLNAEPAVPPGLPAYHFFSTDAGEEREPLPGAMNAAVQTFCPGRAVSHADEPIDAAMQQLIAAALRGGPLATDCPPQS
ncbi:alpha/beta hydrolase [Nocardia brasiliensis]|uniref:Alpha/beta hydrolase n=1 Tax=Nocardia brasiliensis TaxID=37326 RepID=A0A6G9XU29_NOCBR|nr:alpha/beta hydrolase [Nocardia brasiliensis]QIS04434.1 alpha/beta hydrolase [Nocardia brasiliensis]